MIVVLRTTSEVTAPRTLRPGALDFFNTLNKPFSHVDVYIGDGRFIHAPSSKGKVRIERMDNLYFVPSFEMALFTSNDVITHLEKIESLPLL